MIKERYGSANSALPTQPQLSPKDGSGRHLKSSSTMKFNPFSYEPAQTQKLSAKEMKFLKDLCLDQNDIASCASPEKSRILIKEKFLRFQKQKEKVNRQQARSVVK